VASITEPARDVEVIRETDVLVIGGGPAGIGASVAAARMGARVVLIERYGCLGGLATGGLVIWIPGFRPGGSEVYGGLAAEWMREVEKAGAVAYRECTETKQGALADPEEMKLVALDMVVDSGVDVLFHAWAVAAIGPAGDARGAIIESKSGRQAVLAKVTVDASGDADVVAWSKGAFVTGKKGIGLPYRVGGVDWEKYSRFASENPDRMTELRQELGHQGYARIPRPWDHRLHNDLAWVNTWGPTEYDAISVDDLTKVEITMRKDIRGGVRFLRERVPGFERSFLVDVASQIGTRDSRRIVGDYTLTMDDLKEGRTFPDAIGRMCNDPWVKVVCELPYRCLVPKNVENLLVAGRPISAEQNVHEATRLIPPCMTTGEAAGIAAAIAVKSGVCPRNVDVAQVQAALRADGIVI
jgi:hypothetical protein